MVGASAAPHELEPQPHHVRQADLVAVRERALAPDHCAVLQRGIGLAAVAQQHAAALAHQLRVEPRDARVDQHHVAVGLPAQPHPVGRQRKARAGELARTLQHRDVSPGGARRAHHRGLAVGLGQVGQVHVDDLGVLAAPGFGRAGGLEQGAQLEHHPAHADLVPGPDTTAGHRFAVHQGRIRRRRQVLDRPAVPAEDELRLPARDRAVAQPHTAAARAGLVAAPDLDLRVDDGEPRSPVHAFHHDQGERAAAAQGRRVPFRGATTAPFPPGHRDESPTGGSAGSSCALMPVR